MIDTPPTSEAAVTNDDDLESRAIDFVLKSKTESEEYYAKQFQKFLYFQDLYIRGAAKKNTPYGRANLELPIAFQQIEAYTSQLSETTIGESPYITFVGRKPEDDAPAEDITDFTQYQLETGGFVNSFVPFLRSLGKNGSSFFKVMWETEYETRTKTEVVSELEFDDASGQYIETQKEIPNNYVVKTFDGPKFANLSVFDCFIPKGAVDCDVRKMSYFTHRTYRDLDTLLKNPNYKRGYDKLKKAYESDENGNPSFGDGRDQKLSELEKSNPNAAKKFTDKIEVLECWCTFDWKKTDAETGKKTPDNKPSLLVVAICNGQNVLLRLEINPVGPNYKPFIMCNDYPREGDPYGYGELDHIKGLIEESTALRNARLDVANISLNRVWLVERQSGVNLRELYTAPNKVILTNDLNGIRALDMAGVTPSSVEELGRIDADIQNTTDLINPRQDVSGISSAIQGTATGVNYLQSKTSLRFMTKTRMLEETFFKPLGMMLQRLNQELITDETEFRFSNNPQSPYRHIGPEAFLTQVDFKPTSAPDKVNTAQQRDNISFMMQTVGQIEKASPGILNLHELLPVMFKGAGFNHSEKYVNPPQVTVFQTPQGQLVDQKGQPVNVQPAPMPQGAPPNGPG